MGNQDQQNSTHQPSYDMREGGDSAVEGVSKTAKILAEHPGGEGLSKQEYSELKTQEAAANALSAAAGEAEKEADAVQGP